MSQASVYHALIVIFLEFFSWGLLTSPMITALRATFGEQTFLMNGIVMGVKGFLSFLSAPLIGSLSDIWGRRYLLLITVFFTCLPIPFMAINSFIFFVLISVSGAFAVTFTVVFAYVADITTDEDRSSAYGLVSATFAASLVISPALGAYISQQYGDLFVVLLATTIALIDVAFVYCFVPESLGDMTRRLSRVHESDLDKVTSSSEDSSAFWKLCINPISAISKVFSDPMIPMLCIAVLLSYLPEAGQYSCFFVYIRLVVGFSGEDVALFIAVIGLLSVIAQTCILSTLMLTLDQKTTIMFGLCCQMAQLLLYGISTDDSILWFAGVLAALSTITYPAISCYVSTHADADEQGIAQGMITGVRGLCNGLGPAMFGYIFDMFNVNLNDEALTHPITGLAHGPLIQVDHHQRLNLTQVHQNQKLSFNPSSFNSSSSSGQSYHHQIMNPASNSPLIPGPPFVFGSLLVLLAIIVTRLIPQYKMIPSDSPSISQSKSMKSGSKSYSKYYYTNVSHEGDGSKQVDEKDDDVPSSPHVATKDRSFCKIEARLRGKNSVELSIPLISGDAEHL